MASGIGHYLVDAGESSNILCRIAAEQNQRRSMGRSNIMASNGTNIITSTDLVAKAWQY